MRLVQVCNVGNICGGTAACAWTIARALPEFNPIVVCLGQPTAETIRAFHPVEIRPVKRIDDELLQSLQADLALLHNTAASHAGTIRSCVSIQYLHSSGRQAPADLTIACSQWLSNQQKTAVPVVYQPVPVPPQEMIRDCASRSRAFDDELIVGRICTPVLRKWPENCMTFYSHLASECPFVRWEFVGCPENLKEQLAVACRGRVRFLEASWLARANLWRWHALLYHHPTLTESFGRTVAEAMRAGCIPIVDARGGFAEQIENGRSGFLCGDAHDFLAAIRTISEPESRWKIANAAMQEGTARFSLRAFSSTFRQLLDSYSMMPTNRCSS